MQTTRPMSTYLNRAIVRQMQTFVQHVLRGRYQALAAGWSLGSRIYIPWLVLCPRDISNVRLLCKAEHVEWCEVSASMKIFSWRCDAARVWFARHDALRYRAPTLRQRDGACAVSKNSPYSAQPLSTISAHMPLTELWQHERGRRL